MANSVIIVVLVIAAMIFITSFFELPRLNQIVYHHIASKHFLQRLLAVGLLFVAWNLSLRKRAAWLICVLLLTGSLFLNLALRHHSVTWLIIILELYALVTLLFTQGHFKRPSNRLTLKRAGIFTGFILVAVLLNAVVGYVHLGAHADAPLSFMDSLRDTAQMLFDVGDNTSQRYSYERLVFYSVWLTVAFCVFMMLQTVIRKELFTKKEHAHARELVRQYGQNPVSYLTLEDDKALYFGKDVPGVIPYRVVGGTVVVCGDPICASDNFVSLLAEFKSFCTEAAYQCVFLGTTDVFLEQYSMLGYHHVKSGEEARFRLANYELAGGKMAKMRAQVNHANKAGLTTYEYRPNENRDAEIEKGIHTVSDQWLQGKKSGQLGFTLGGVGLENPMDRRYFYARDTEGEIVAFHVFVPFAGMNGYMADITRRTPDAPGGVTEKINYDAFMAFKEEGVEWGSLGLAPLANIYEEGENPDINLKFLHFIYEKCNRFYGFKSLHQAKEKYSPTMWVPGYFVYSTKNLTPQITYAIIKIQNPGGMKDYLRSFFGESSG